MPKYERVHQRLPLGTVMTCHALCRAHRTYALMLPVAWPSAHFASVRASLGANEKQASARWPSTRWPSTRTASRIDARVQLPSSTASWKKLSEVNRANAFARRARRSASSALHAQLNP
jgi:hypothetical protein